MELSKARLDIVGSAIEIARVTLIGIMMGVEDNNISEEHLSKKLDRFMAFKKDRMENNTLVKAMASAMGLTKEEILNPERNAEIKRHVLAIFKTIRELR